MIWSGAPHANSFSVSPCPFRTFPNLDCQTYRSARAVQCASEAAEDLFYPKRACISRTVRGNLPGGMVKRIRIPLTDTLVPGLLKSDRHTEYCDFNFKFD